MGVLIHRILYFCLIRKEAKLGLNIPFFYEATDFANGKRRA